MSYQEERAGKAWDKLSVLQELFASLSKTNDCKDEGLFDGLQEITQSIIYDVRAVCDSVEFHPELEQFETSVLEKELASRERIDQAKEPKEEEVSNE